MCSVTLLVARRPMPPMHWLVRQASATTPATHWQTEAASAPKSRNGRWITDAAVPVQLITSYCPLSKLKRYSYGGRQHIGPLT